MYGGLTCRSLPMIFNPRLAEMVMAFPRVSRKSMSQLCILLAITSLLRQPWNSIFSTRLASPVQHLHSHRANVGTTFLESQTVLAALIALAWWTSVDVSSVIGFRISTSVALKEFPPGEGEGDAARCIRGCMTDKASIN